VTLLNGKKVKLKRNRRLSGKEGFTYFLDDLTAKNILILNLSLQLMNACTLQVFKAGKLFISLVKLNVCFF
jgi:hypothetical protein